MLRKIIHIDEDACNGCGNCVIACHEDAIHIVNGVAKLIKDEYCDGLGDCLPTCPMSAITFEERETQPYNEVAVKLRIAQKTNNTILQSWPIQLKLAPVIHERYQGSEILLAADCTAFAYPHIQQELQQRVTLIACPKLDGQDYSEKLTQILVGNNIHSVRILRMEVPCCKGLLQALQKAISESGKQITVTSRIVTRDGVLLKEG